THAGRLLLEHGLGDRRDRYGQHTVSGVQSTHRVAPSTAAAIAICRNALALSRTLSTNAGASLASAARACSSITESSISRGGTTGAHSRALPVAGQALA